MTDTHKPLPVAGYTDQPNEKAALVNEFKADEERLLRKIDALTSGAQRKITLTLAQVAAATENNVPFAAYAESVAMNGDARWLSIARTHFQEGFMALNRAVFQPQRIKLPEDE